MKAAVSAVLAGVGLMGLVALAPTSASALPVATTGIQTQSEGAEALTQVRWHGHRRWHHRRAYVMRHHGWHRGHHYGWGHRRHHRW